MVSAYKMPVADSQVETSRNAQWGGGDPLIEKHWPKARALPAEGIGRKKAQARLASPAPAASASLWVNLPTVTKWQLMLQEERGNNKQGSGTGLKGQILAASTLQLWAAFFPHTQSEPGQTVPEYIRAHSWWTPQVWALVASLKKTPCCPPNSEKGQAATF